MITKLLIALAVAVAGWWLWKGPRSSWTTGHRSDGPYVPVASDQLEAFRVLGLAPGASEKEIRAAHRRLLIEVHPDRGGSPELARKANAARDALLDAPKRDD
jgi:hypothetical protein